MADSEKVIKGLEYCTGNHLCSNCGYYDPNNTRCKTDLMRDAFILLSAQEPRVLTWEEVKTAEVCWLEQRGYEPFVTLEANTWNPEQYGKSYRCWNHMPTDKQRKEEVWSWPRNAHGVAESCFVFTEQ